MNDENPSSRKDGQESEPEGRDLVKVVDEPVGVRGSGRSGSDEDDQGSDEGDAGTTPIRGACHGTGSLEGRWRVKANYAELWWTDAVYEASLAADADDAEAIRSAVRRQVVFAVCAIESWFFEWVRDEVLDDSTAAEPLFAEGGRESLTDRIKRVLCELHARGKLATEPGFAESDAWEDLHNLLDDRHGLVHAVASLPRGDVPPDAATARPTPERLVALAPAGPIGTIRGIVELVTGFADAEAPEWMEDPDPDA